MDFNIFQSFTGGQIAPWLPPTDWARWALRVSWAVVLAACVLRAGQSIWPAWRKQIALLVALWALWPGLPSPSYWLGLAFQMPSLMSVVLCAVWTRQMWSRPESEAESVFDLAVPEVLLAGLGVTLGWVLLADMLAWWPVSVYAWGFGTPALAMACGLTLLIWLVAASGKPGQRGVRYVAAVLLVFALTRLPSGNLWDALLDPWLWLVLQIKGWVVLLHRSKH